MKYVLLFSCLIFIAATCSKTTSQEKSLLQSLDGKWTMVSYVAFMPDLPILKKGDIIWKFDTKNAKVETKMKDAKRTEDIGFNPGTYSYKMDGDKIIINGRDYFYKINEDGTSMKLDKNTDPELSKDRPVMTFSRMTK